MRQSRIRGIINYIIVAPAHCFYSFAFIILRSLKSRFYAFLPIIRYDSAKPVIAISERYYIIMDIKNKSVLVLGGWGLVGSAVVRRIAAESPKKIIITSLLKAEAQDAVATFHKEFPKIKFEAWWGNIFVRTK